MNAFITQAIFEAPVPRQCRRPPVEKGDLARLLDHTARINDRLHETAPGEDDDGMHVEAALADLAVIRAALLRALGRVP